MGESGFERKRNNDVFYMSIKQKNNEGKKDPDCLKSSNGLDLSL